MVTLKNNNSIKIIDFINFYDIMFFGIYYKLIMNLEFKNNFGYLSELSKDRLCRCDLSVKFISINFLNMMLPKGR